MTDIEFFVARPTHYWMIDYPFDPSFKSSRRYEDAGFDGLLFFDSQNLAFWNPHTKKYVDFHRTFTNGIRDIMTCTSDDFVHWTKPVLLKYPGAPHQHLYTNAIRAYERAPHLLN